MNIEVASQLAAFIQSWAATHKSYLAQGNVISMTQWGAHASEIQTSTAKLWCCKICKLQALHIAYCILKHLH